MKTALFTDRDERHGALVERDRGRETDGVKLSLNQYLDRWLNTARNAPARENFRGLSVSVEKAPRPQLGEKRLEVISPLDIQAIYKQMLDRKLSARTVHYMHNVVGSALRQAVKWQMLEKSPASGVQLARVHRPELKVLDLEQSRLFLKTFRASKAPERLGRTPVRMLVRRQGKTSEPAGC
jgi:hypothetical protein